VAAVGRSSPYTVLEALRGDDLHRKVRALVDLEGAVEPPSRAVVECLTVLLADPDKQVRRRAAGALAVAARGRSYSGLLAELLTDGDRNRRWGACFALSLAGRSSAATFRTALACLDHDDRDVGWAAAQLAVQACREDRSRVAAVRGLLSEPNADRRKMALYCLRDIGGACMTVFADALSDGSPAVRLAALAGLFRLSQEPSCLPADTDVIARVRDRLQHDPRAQVRRVSAVVLGRIMGGNREARLALERAAGDRRDSSLSRAAQKALAASDHG